MIDDNIPALKIESNEDGTLTLEQDWCGNVDRVAIHSVHIRLLAERAGIVQAGNNRYYGPTAAALARRLTILRDRIKELDTRLWAVPVYPPGANDADPDLWFSDATLTLAEEFCADLEPMSNDATRPPASPTGQLELPAISSRR